MRNVLSTGRFKQRMPLLATSGLSKFYGADEVFSNVNLEIPASARIALVGPNGAGKTTLANILAAIDIPTEGRVTTARNARVACLPQRPELAGTHSLWAEQLKPFDDLRAMEARLAELEQGMADAEEYDAALAAYGPLQAEFERRGGYTYESRIKRALTGVGFALDDCDMPLPRLSGGQKTRALLCRLLLEEPDLLILDEPTSHLDIDGVEWLENFLKSFPGAVLAVSHDRYFIDGFAAVVWEMESKRVQVYRGDYTHYLRQRAERRQRLRKEFDAQQELIAKEMDYIRRHMGSRWTAQAKGRLKKLATLKKRGKILPPPRRRGAMKLDMHSDSRSGDQVIVTEDLAVGYPPGKPLAHIPDVLVLRGETVAVIGPNGVGKSTLLKTFGGDLAPLAGRMRLGANVKPGYLAQAHETLNASHSILEEILAVKAMPISAARQLLGRFMFSDEDVFRPIATLSGGERGRVALAKLTLQGANLLLLDEPTNHLDMDSQEILQAVLAAFEGTILLVSHDRYLIDALATQVWDMTPGRLTVFEGAYQEFVRVRKRRLEKKQAKDQAGRRGIAKGKKAARYAKKKHGLNPFEAKKKITQLEAKIDELESSLSAAGRQLDAAGFAGDAVKVAALGAAYAQTEAELEAALTEWGKFFD